MANDKSDERGSIEKDAQLASARKALEELEKAVRLAVEELGWGEFDQARRRLRAALSQRKPDG